MTLALAARNAAPVSWRKSFLTSIFPGHAAKVAAQAEMAARQKQEDDEAMAEIAASVALICAEDHECTERHQLELHLHALRVRLREVLPVTQAGKSAHWWVGTFKLQLRTISHDSQPVVEALEICDQAPGSATGKITIRMSFTSNALVVDDTPYANDRTIEIIGSLLKSWPGPKEYIYVCTEG